MAGQRFGFGLTGEITNVDYTKRAINATHRAGLAGSVCGFLRRIVSSPSGFSGIFALLVALTGSPAFAQVHQIDNAQLTQMANAGVPVIDIRTPREWKTTGVMQGSHLLTFFDERGQFDMNAWMEKFSDIVGPDDPVLIICAAGVRSAAVAKVLSDKLGYRQIHNVTRGIDDWMRQGGRTREWTP